MSNSNSYLAVIVLVGSVSGFLQFQDNVEYEFKFRSKINLSPSFLEGQSVNATLVVRKFGTDGSSLIVCIKDSEAVGKNVDSKSKSNIEGVFGVKRSISGAVEHIISKSTDAAIEVLTKKSIVSMLSDDFSFFNDYVRHPETRSRKSRVELSIGLCDSDITATTDVNSGLTNILAQAEKRKCNVNPLIIKTGQFLLQGTTRQIGRIEDDSNFGMSIMYDTTSGQMLEVSKFTFLNLIVSGFEVQARHNMILDYVGEHPVTGDTNFEKPYFPFSMADIDNFIRDQAEQE